MSIDISRFKTEFANHLDYASFNYGKNPVLMMVVPCELNELILRFDEIKNDVKKIKIEDIYKMNDRIILKIKAKILHCVVIKFINIANNIYELHITLVKNIVNIQELSEI